MNGENSKSNTALASTACDCYARVGNERIFKIDIEKSTKIAWWIKLLLKFKREIIVTDEINEFTSNHIVYKKLGGVSFIVDEFGTTNFSFPEIEITVNNDKGESA